MRRRTPPHHTIAAARLRPLALSALLLMFAAVGCSGGSSSVVVVPTATASPTSSPTLSPSPTPTPRPIGASACSAPSFTPLSKCITDSQNDVVIGGSSAPAGCRNVFVDQSYSVLTGNPLGSITINNGGLLVIADQTAAPAPIEIDTTSIVISGQFAVGNAACPIGTTNANDHVTINFTGARACPSGNCSGMNKGVFVAAGGALNLYGVKGVPAHGGVSWTYLAAPAGPGKYSAANGVLSPVPTNGATTLQLADDVTKGTARWSVGDWITVATTSFSPYETEFVQIANVSPNPAGGSQVMLSQSLLYYHFGGPDPGPPSATNFNAGSATNYGVDERAEVGLISRNIKLTATISSDAASIHWGGEMMAMKGFAAVAMQGVEIEKFGKDQLGSYPIHFHKVGSLSGLAAGDKLVDANSIHHSYNKCVTIHSTSELTIQNNVCARVVGHIFYQEIDPGDDPGADEVDQDLDYEHNLGLGAMSNSFDIHSQPALPRSLLIGSYWWPGDQLATDKYGYDGFNIADSDDQGNFTHGSCATFNPTSTPGYAFDGSLNIGAPPAPTCGAGQIYFEPASGFWIMNPGTRLVGNSIGGCQGVGRGYWYVPPENLAGYPMSVTNLIFAPVGEFTNNRVHSCYSGLYDEEEFGVQSNSLFPNDPKTSEPIIGTFNGLTATRNRDRGIWMRPSWYTVNNARLATNRDSVTLVSTGGLDGNVPGFWSLLENSVIVGRSQNNVDRFGPCPAGLSFLGPGFGCIDQTPVLSSNVTLSTPPEGADQIGLGYPTPHWNFAGFMIYDGPVRIFGDRFVNFNKDITPFLTADDKAFLAAYQGPPVTPKVPFVYEGDAALGWFQSNQSNYPTATSVKGLTWDNVDLRHQVYTDDVNLGPFNDGDKNTSIMDIDGSLTGFSLADPMGTLLRNQFPLSLNNEPFNATSNAVDECLASGAQNDAAEGRPTSIISAGPAATLEFSQLYPNPVTTKNPFPGGDHTQLVTFTRDSSDFGVHQPMTLHSRNQLGIWEPKVISGYGYTVSAAPDPMDNQGTGIANRIDIGVDDVFMEDVSPSNPFYVRVGICYTNTDGTHPQDPTKFAITRGYKSYGGGNVNFNDSKFQQFFNRLLDRYNNETCFNLDFQNQGNLDPVHGCPADGVTPVPTGGCPAPSTQSTDQNGMPACIYPKTTLTMATSILSLIKSDGSPDFTKYFYDPASGMLFLYIGQDSPNAFGPSPLGSCTGAPTDDPSCPDVAGGESYYACPAQGCSTDVILLNDSTYAPGASNCSPYPTYIQSPPVNQNQLSYAGTSIPVVQKPNFNPVNPAFPHYEPAKAPVCPVTSPHAAPAATAGGG